MKIKKKIKKIYSAVDKLTCQLCNGFIINNVYIIINIIYNVLLVNKIKNVKNNMIINVKKCQEIVKAKTRNKNANKRWNFDSTGACTIKTFYSCNLWIFCNKLQCLYLASLSSLV